ncbi:AKR_collapsed_G0027920.mRNA.1.CDS.1 [Saccharomyces cerevisiae]|nr:AKR_collapsed_G0027920.mRNA.1.CDS.1 [Saccharomyces cerevisiae]
MTEVFLATMESSKVLRTYSNLADIVMKDNGRLDSGVLKQFNDYVKQEKLNLQHFQAGSSKFLKGAKI